jgi:uncharacterized membrane protein YebE (DUF533 family)
MNRFALATAIVLTSVAGAHAYDFGSNSTAEIDARRAQELRRIEDGRRAGQLSNREYRALMAEQRQIAHDVRVAKSDGYVSPAERARLNAEVNQASADISRLKHNQETAYNRPWFRRWWY